jgi:hypothetical protein
MIVLGVVFLNIGHPGLVFDPHKNNMEPNAAVKIEPTLSIEGGNEGAMV